MREHYSDGPMVLRAVVKRDPCEVQRAPTSRRNCNQCTVDVGLNQILTDLVFGLYKLRQSQALVKTLSEHGEDESEGVEPRDVMLFGCITTHGNNILPGRATLLLAEVLHEARSEQRRAAGRR